jgi:hypothetical protein
MLVCFPGRIITKTHHYHFFFAGEDFDGVLFTAGVSFFVRDRRDDPLIIGDGVLPVLSCFLYPGSVSDVLLCSCLIVRRFDFSLFFCF